MGDQDKIQSMKCLETRGLEPRTQLMSEVEREWKVTVSAGIRDTSVVN